MNTLITPVQVLRLAFSGTALSPETVDEADIAAAEEHYVVPVIGRALYEKLLNGDYAPFRTGFLAKSVALFTRVLIQPRLDVRTEGCGTIAPKSAYAQPADDLARRRMRQALRQQARELLHRAVEHLAAHAIDFPEYDPDADIGNRCSIHGNLIQTH